MVTGRIQTTVITLYRSELSSESYVFPSVIRLLKNVRCLSAYSCGCDEITCG